MDVVINTVISLLTLPILVVMWPVDLLLQQIPDIERVPEAISAILTYVGNIPSTMVSLLGISPILWNAIFVTFVTYLVAVPSINLIKKIWAWVRP